MTATDLILSHTHNHIGYLILNRPQAFNALNIEMIRAMQQQLDAWQHDSDIYAICIRGNGEKAFCAGGDIRDMYHNHLKDPALKVTFFQEEYALDYTLHTYKKPVIVIAHQLVLGGGMGLLQGADFRVISEQTRLGMPEVAIGYFPDVGASYFLSRLPHQAGPYMGITGNTLNATDALTVGLADYCLPLSHLSHLQHELEQIHWEADAFETIQRLLLQQPSTQPDSELNPHWAAIEQHFQHNAVTDIVASLQNESRPEHQNWAQQTLDTIASRSPIAMCMALALQQRGKHMTLKDCFDMELYMDSIWFKRGDIMEGVRALSIDKDKNPVWNPATLEAVTPDKIQSFFTDFK